MNKKFCSVVRLETSRMSFEAGKGRNRVLFLFNSNYKNSNQMKKEIKVKQFCAGNTVNLESLINAWLNRNSLFVEIHDIKMFGLNGHDSDNDIMMYKSEYVVLIFYSRI